MWSSLHVSTVWGKSLLTVKQYSHAVCSAKGPVYGTEQICRLYDAKSLKREQLWRNENRHGKEANCHNGALISSQMWTGWQVPRFLFFFGGWGRLNVSPAAKERSMKLVCSHTVALALMNHWGASEITLRCGFNITPPPPRHLCTPWKKAWKIKPLHQTGTGKVQRRPERWKEGGTFLEVWAGHTSSTVQQVTPWPGQVDSGLGYKRKSVCILKAAECSI